MIETCPGRIGREGGRRGGIFEDLELNILCCVV